MQMWSIGCSRGLPVVVMRTEVTVRLEDVPILAVWDRLGGGEIRRGRARAFWRRGDNPTAVAIDPDKGCFFDHVAGVGGGVLALVRVARGCSQAEALSWLESEGFIEPRRLTRAEVRRHLARRAQANLIATRIEHWRAARAEALDREKVEAVATGDFVALEVAANELYRLEHGSAADVMGMYRDALRKNPVGVTALVAQARSDHEIVVLAVAALCHGYGLKPESVVVDAATA